MLCMPRPYATSICTEVAQRTVLADAGTICGPSRHENTHVSLAIRTGSLLRRGGRTAPMSLHAGAATGTGPRERGCQGRGWLRCASW